LDKNRAVLKLVNQIDAGKRTYAQTVREIKRIEKRGGALDMLYQIEDRMDQAYMEELVKYAHMGIYSKDSILKMAAINDERSKKYWKRSCIFASIILLVIVIGVICILC
jgi:hypothetical protein